uniref:Uncharacterized protein n=1 Tax=Panagrolaimus sp. ES5 TaxID=591445 RepID=A0AC34EZV2_9BILA
MIDVLTQRIGTMQNPAGGTEAERLNADDASTPSFGRQFQTKTSENSVNELSVQSLLLANDRPNRTKFLKSPSDDSLR